MILVRGALSLMLVLALGCGDDTSAGTDTGPGTDSGTGTDSATGTDTGTAADTSTGTDTGTMMFMNATAAEVITGNAASLAAICECVFEEEEYASAAECVADNGATEIDDMCFREAFAANEADVEGFFGCLLAATNDFTACVEASGCDNAMVTACNDAQEAASDACPAPAMAVVESFSGTLDSCTAAALVGEPSGCPDSDATSSTVGAMAFTGTTNLMGDDADPSCGASDPAGGADVQLQWTAPSTGDFVIDTSGSDFDTVLYVLDGCEGEEVACNDDGEDLTSSLTLSATADTEYLIVVDGYDSGEAGAYVVNINEAAEE